MWLGCTPSAFLVMLMTAIGQRVEPLLAVAALLALATLSACLRYAGANALQMAGVIALLVAGALTAGQLRSYEAFFWAMSGLLCSVWALATAAVLALVRPARRTGAKSPTCAPTE